MARSTIQRIRAVYSQVTALKRIHESQQRVNEIDDDNDGRSIANDLGCIAASWDSETDLCGQGVPVYEYLLGSVAAYGGTESEMATNVIDPNAPGCGRSGKPENIFVYRNQFRSRLTISTDYPETMTNTSVYLRARCLSGESELACDDSSSNGSNRGALTVDAVEPGIYFVTVKRPLACPVASSSQSKQSETRCSAMTKSTMMRMA